MAASSSGDAIIKALFECPSWAGKPPPGLHLDVIKGDKMIEKLIIDEKKYYLFGRNQDLCDFPIDHQSCSRVHAALVYHKHLKRVFIIDLNSTHGSFLGQIRLEPHKPQQVPVDTTLTFGASTRTYTLRERPQTLPGGATGKGEEKNEEEEMKGGLLGLPEEETELDNLTDFNTAHNKRIATLTIEEGNLDLPRPKRRRRSFHVSFSEDEEVINPEDIDPSVGRFRNMIQTAVVPLKRKQDGPGTPTSPGDSSSKRLHGFPFSSGLYSGIPGGESGMPPTSPSALGPGAGATALIGGLPLPLPNPAPDVEVFPEQDPAPNLNSASAAAAAAAAAAATAAAAAPEPGPTLPRKKKYAKEAWPGKKPTPSLLI
ncbi:nuclear inhibitor of protein phosphatase 1 isoform X3 [Petromyzon marinus]|uniref:Nuclear inhibitor of protein phosphatase 1 n=1 Tax=Petromyzon marinus TaxID=7757 RepID=A0AAJ7X1H1_PETMA|nr:nuclear inhibitor of protein phosphatase 1 isoform X1 [Petromyzon marinus]